MHKPEHMVLSVAMCTYNGAKYIGLQLDSILQQKLPVDEIVVCDDGSNDDTIAIVRHIAKENPQIRWNIQQNVPNLGVTKNFEKALRLCTGDIIFLSDQDDVWRKDKTEVIADYFDRHRKMDVVFTDAELIDDDGKSISKYSLLDSVELLPYIDLWNAGAEVDFINMCNRATGATMAVRKPFLSKVLPFEIDKYCLHDEQLAMGASAYKCLGVITERLIGYRQHGKNVLGVPRDKWIFTGKPCPNSLEEILKNRGIKREFMKYVDVSPHLRFYLKRNRIRISLVGKLILLLSLPTYVREYGRYWFSFYYYDLTLALTYAIGIRRIFSKPCTGH